MKVEKIKIVEKRGNTTLFEKKKVSISIFRDDSITSLMGISQNGWNTTHLVEAPILHDIDSELMTFTGLFKGKIVFVYVWTYDR